MDISVFNLLMSTTPNANSIENAFGAGTSAVPNIQEDPQTKQDIGAAFLKALENARTGKADKSSEVLFNTMAANVEAKSSLKDLAKSNTNKEDVKIVKLHIKRTRSSTKLQNQETAKSVEQKQTDHRQKIPTQEKITPANDVGIPFVPENAETDVSLVLPEQVITEQNFEMSDTKTDFVSNEDLTAMDILISTAIQASVVQEKPLQTVETASVSEQNILPNKDVSSEVEQTETTPVSSKPETLDVPEIAEKPEQIFTPAKQAEGQKMPVEVQQENKELSFDNFKTTETQEIETKDVVKEVVKETVKTTPLVHTEKTATQAPVLQQAVQIDKPETKESKSERHVQAEQIATSLPTDTNLSIEVNVDYEKSTSLEKESSDKPSVKAEEKDETHSMFDANESSDFTPDSAEQSFEKQGDTKEIKRPVLTEEKPTMSMQNTFAPMEQKATSALQTQTTSSETGSNISQPNNVGQPVLHTQQTALKGKAVSGTQTPVKQTPMNELIDNIKVNIKKAMKAGLDKIDIILKPKNLGTIKVHIEVDSEGTLKATISTARADTLELLKSDLSLLKQSLSDSGFNFNDESFAFNYKGEDSNKNERSFNQEEQKEKRSELSIQNTTELDAQEMGSSLDKSSLYGLNIKV